jgi:hypothetical protein
MSAKNISGRIRSIIKSAAAKLSGVKRRVYIAEVAIEFCDGNARKTERVFGWGRETIDKGMRELQTGIPCQDNYSARGNKKTEEKIPQLAEDIREIVDPKSQADPHLKTPFAYTRITAKAVRQALIDQKGYRDDQLPCENTIGEILNRLGYRIRRVQKTKPLKKVPQTDDIFKNIEQANQQADEKSGTKRISVDVKAKVNVGEFSRGGKSRGKEAEKAVDHDVAPDVKLAPVGILDTSDDLLTIIFGNSFETSDLIADSLELWWQENKERNNHIIELAINLDNGPHMHSHRTQFMKRMIELADKTGIKIHLLYYPPYHSKYNPIERCWGILEDHWNGTILNSVDKTIKWAETMTWKGLYPVVHLLDKVYKKGVKLTKKAMKVYEERLTRSETLPKWDVIIEPVLG